MQVFFTCLCCSHSVKLLFSEKFSVLTQADLLMAGLLPCWPLTSEKLYWFWAKAGLCIYE